MFLNWIILFSEPATQAPIPDLPSNQPHTQMGQIFIWIYHIMHDTCVLSFGGFTFNLWDVSVTVIILSLLGWMLGKFLNPWGHDNYE